MTQTDDDPIPSPLPSWSLAVHKALQVERRAAKDARAQVRNLEARIVYLEREVDRLRKGRNP